MIRRNRRLGYAIDNILTGCKLLDLELPDLILEHKQTVEQITNTLRDINNKAKEVETLLLTVGNIYEKFVPIDERNVEQ